MPAPLLIPALAWCLGIWLGKTAEWAFLPWLGLALGLLFCAILIRRYQAWFLLLLCVALGGMRFQAAQRPSQLDQIFLRQSHIQQDARFLVTKLLSREAQLYEIRLDSLAGIRVREPLLLYAERELEPGQSYSALLELLPGKQDPVLDTYPTRHRAYIRQNLTALQDKRKLLPFATWRVWLLGDLDAKLGPDADFAKALLWSDTSAKGIYRDQLTRSGMIHLIVVSGLHIWFIYAMCMVLLNAVLPRRGAELLFLLLIVIYAALNHWSPSVVRSVLMIGLFVVARWRGIPLGGAQLLSLSLLAITIVSPNQLFDIGLQLSFLCVGVIMLGLPHIVWIKEWALPDDRIRLRLSKFLDLLLLNLAVGLAVLPVTLYYFGTASLNGIVGNILGIPMSGALLAICFLIQFIPGGNWLSAAFIASYRLLLRLFEAWTDGVAKLPGYLENTWLSHWQLLGSLLLVLCLLHMLRNLKLQLKALPLAALGLALVFLPGLGSAPKGGMYVFACGTADCILSNFPDGTTLLVDSGPWYRDSEMSWAARKLLPWLQKKDLRKIDWLVLTHLDSDHSGGFPDLAKAGMLDQVIVSDETLRDPQWQEWSEAGLLEDLQVHCVADTLTIHVGPARLKFLHPDKNYFSDTSNGSSLLLRMDHAGKRYLFAGDADTDAEAHLLSHYPQELKADYLKAGHHGSRTSSSAEFVRAVLPDEVWITAAARNQWGFPHPEPLAAFRHYAKSVRGTAQGTIFLPFAKKD